MTKERIEEYTGNAGMSIVDAMEKIDRNAKGILFIVDQKAALVGCITDGDIRRWLIKTGNLRASVANAMKKSPRYLPERQREQAECVMRRESVGAIPILDDRKNITDIIFLSEIHDGKPRRPGKNLKGVPVVIMAGGKGTRLYPYTKILPKPLIPVGEVPIIERIIKCFTEYGIDRYYVTVNYKKGMIKSYFSELNPGYRIIYVEEERPLGTGGSIRLIREKFHRPLFVANADSLILADYGEIYDYHLKSGNDITIISALKNIVVPYGVLHSRENGELVDMEEKPRLSYFINTGMYIMNPELIEKIPAQEMFHMTQLVDRVLKDGGKAGVYPVSEDSFLDMGEFDEMKRMEEKLRTVSE